MKTIGYLVALICTCLFLAPNAAQAQATRTWVSGVGDDANPCSRTAPCKTFAGAIAKTATGGEIDVLDPSGFGALTITKSITIDGSGGNVAGVLVAGTNGITINDLGAGTAVVTLRNLDFEGLGYSTTSPGIRGISFVSGAVLHVQHCVIRNFRDPSNGNGISFTPAAPAKLFVQDTTVQGSGVAAGTGGIVIQPSGTGSAIVALERVDVVSNALGIRAETTGSTGAGVFLSIKDSESSGNTNGGIIAFAQSGSPPVTTMIDRTMISHNGVGINANGTAATLRIGNSTIMNNATGIKQQNSSTMTSYGTNEIADNPIPGFTMPVVGPT